MQSKFYIRIAFRFCCIFQCSCSSRNNICNNLHKTLCSSCNLRQCQSIWKLKSGFNEAAFKRQAAVNINPKKIEAGNPYLDYLIDQQFQGTRIHKRYTFSVNFGRQCTHI